MSPDLIFARKVYFSFLFSYFIFLSVLIMLIRNPDQLTVDIYFKAISTLLSLIPAGLFIFRWKVKKINRKTFLALCIIGFIPVIAGTIFSLIKSNYIYFVLLFPIFFLSYLVIIPTKNFIEDNYGLQKNS